MYTPTVLVLYIRASYLYHFFLINGRQAEGMYLYMEDSIVYVC